MPLPGPLHGDHRPLWPSALAAVRSASQVDGWQAVRDSCALEAAPPTPVRSKVLGGARVLRPELRDPQARRDRRSTALTWSQGLGIGAINIDAPGLRTQLQQVACICLPSALPGI